MRTTILPGVPRSFRLWIVCLLLPSMGLAVTVETENIYKIKCYKVTTEMGTFYWETGDGSPGKQGSGWISMFDNNGKDWISAGPKGRDPGYNSQYRGFPNSGADDWGHPSRHYGYDNGSTNAIIGDHSGEKVVIESGNSQIQGRWHCFDSHITLELSRASGKYQFLYEGTPGGKVNSDGVVMADGTKKIPIKKKHAENPNWPGSGAGEWFYILDPNNAYHLWFAKTPDGDERGELWRQGGNMDLCSFGRTGSGAQLSGTANKVMFGFLPASMTHAEVKAHVEAVMENPLQPLGGTSMSLEAASQKVAINQSIDLTLSTSLTGSTIAYSLTGEGTLSNETGTGVTYTAGATPGSATITATTTVEGETLTAQYELTVFDPDQVHLKINSGGDNVGDWTAGGSYVSGGSDHDFGSTPATDGVENAAPADVYRTVYHSPGETHQYTFSDLPDGNYTVRLHFYDQSDGRTMSFSIEGSAMLEDFDPPSAPTVKEYAVTVNDGNGLQIQCSGGGGDVFLAGVEVIGLSSTGAGETRRPAGTRSSLGLLRAQKGYLLTVGSVGAYRLEIVNPRGAIVRSFSGTGPAHHTFSAARGVYIVRHAHAPGMQQKVLTVH